MEVESSYKTSLLKQWKTSDLSRACVIRITNKCNQKCRHCMFDSGPNYRVHMSPKTCRDIARWVPSYVFLNIMGGEFSVLENYPILLISLSSNRDSIRLVTNGSWGAGIFSKNKFTKTLKSLESIGKFIEVAISNYDTHYTHSQEAINHVANTIDPTGLVSLTNGGLRPDMYQVGREWLFGKNPPDSSAACEHQCGMIIREDGMICLCPFGYFAWKHFTETTWDEAQQYVWKWRLAKISKGMCCNTCMESVYGRKNHRVHGKIPVTNQKG